MRLRALWLMASTALVVIALSELIGLSLRDTLIPAVVVSIIVACVAEVCRGARQQRRDEAAEAARKAAPEPPSSHLISKPR
jgi:uncharacterized protein YqfA (UPF0365 family)